MKLAFPLLILFAFSFCSNTKPAIESDLVVKSVLKGVFDIHREKPVDRFILVNVKVINNSNTIHRFLTMDCSTGSNLIFDSKNVAPTINNCSGNSITTITLNPKQEFSFVFILKLIPPYPDHLKVGWILLTYENTFSADNYFNVLAESRKRLENIIWAPSFELMSAGGYPYEVK
jgi:hypothetical protein